MVAEAPMEQGPGGKTPAGEGWFVVNAREAQWIHNEKFGAGVTFEGTPHFEQYGINIQVMWPGQPNCYYHAEEGQEDFLVLSGECLLLVEGQERLLRQWDFVHCPPWTEHVLVGAGDGPCAILAFGGRTTEGIVYPVNEQAARYGASVERQTEAAKEAYAGLPPDEPVPYQEGWLPT
jgi:uncharacterized cupin superfamily protein